MLDTAEASLRIVLAQRVPPARHNARQGEGERRCTYDLASGAREAPPILNEGGVDRALHLAWANVKVTILSGSCGSAFEYTTRRRTSRQRVRAKAIVASPRARILNHVWLSGVSSSSPSSVVGLAARHIY